MKNEIELNNACYNLQGKTLKHLADLLGFVIPQDPLQRKGWFGKAVEHFFLVNNQRAAPDFLDLNIELKTLPIGKDCLPNASTFVTYISLNDHYKETWETSRCFKKLARILWIPVEASKEVPFEARRIGLGFLWSPDNEDYQILKQDWNELSDHINGGDLDKINAKFGKYLQIRPKSLNTSQLTSYINSECEHYPDTGVLNNTTLPRGFYLRKIFTEKIVKQYINTAVQLKV